MAEDVGGDRTEKATARRREQARNKGQVAKSQEVNGAFILVVGMAVLVASSSHFAHVLGRNATYLLSQAHSLDISVGGGVRELLKGNLEVMAAALLPLVSALLIAAFGANVMQIGFHASAEALSFKSEKLNPITGMKRFFQKQMFFELLKNVVKIGLVSLLVQTMRFGTSVADALRVYSEEFRDRRMQKAEEEAAKISTKLIFPLVFCLFPSFFSVAIGPAVLRLVAVFSVMGN